MSPTTDDIDGAPARRSSLQSVAALAILTYLAVATFPGRFEALGPGLDPSWMFALNELPHTAFRFGRDVAFAHGPLGYLLVPREIGSNMVHAAAGWVLSQAAMVAVAVYHYRRHRRLGALAAFALGTLLASSFGLFEEYRLLLLVALLLTVPPEDSAAWRAATAGAAVLTAVLAFVRPSTGIAAAATMAAFIAVWLVRRTRPGRILIWAVAPMLGTFVALSLVLIGPATDTIRWLSESLDIAAGFPVAMSFPEPGLLPALALAAVTVTVLGLLVGRVPAPAWAPLLVPAVFAFRHAFVRHHGRFVFSVLLGVLGIALLASASRRAVVAGATALALIVGVAVVAAGQPGCVCPGRPEALLPAEGWGRLWDVVRLGEVRRELEAEGEVHLAADRLPSEWVELLRVAPNGVDVVPTEIAFVPANEVPWNPLPVLQSYVAYTPGLDRRVAEHYRAPDAPDYVLAQFADIDSRHPLLSAPDMWRAILSRYEAVDTVDGPFGRVALLRRRLAPIETAAIVAGEETASVGTWVSVPPSEGVTYAHVDLEERWTATVARLLWRVDPIWIDLRYEDGEILTFRMLPTTAGEGLLLTPLPRSFSDLVRLFEGAGSPRVASFRIRGPGLRSYEPVFNVVWRVAPGMP